MTERSSFVGPGLWCLAAAMLFGVTAPIAKPLVDRAGPVLLSGLLYAGAALAVAPFALFDWRRHGRVPRQTLQRLFGAAFFGGIVGPVLLLAGLAMAPASTVSLWLTLETVATAVLARLFFGEHLGATGVLATLLVVGASVGLTGAAPHDTRAAVLVGLACVAWGLDNNLTALIDGVSTAEITAFKGVVAGAVNVPIGLWLGGELAGTGLAVALGIGAIGYGASLVLYVAGAQQLGATRSQLVFSTAPLFGLAAAFVLLGEPLGGRHAAAVLAMGAAIWLLQRESHGHAHRHGALEHTHWHRHDDDHHDHAHADGSVPSGWHQHSHRHEPLSHSHPHRPDLHHRHTHDAAD